MKWWALISSLATIAIGIWLANSARIVSMRRPVIIVLSLLTSMFTIGALLRVSPFTGLAQLKPHPTVPGQRHAGWGAVKSLQSHDCQTNCNAPRFLKVAQPTTKVENIKLAALESESAALQKSIWNAWSSKGLLMTSEEANQRFNLGKRLNHIDTSPKQRVRVVEGDLRIDGNLLLDWDQQLGTQGLLVTGNLMVNGAIINANSNSGPFLVVGGKTQAFAIVGGGAQLAFEGDAKVTDIVIGFYNDGILEFGAQLTAPAVVTMDHELTIRGKLDGRWFDTFNGSDEWSSFIDPKQTQLRRAMEEDEWSGLKRQLIPILKTGKSVLRPDLPAKAKHAKYGG